MGVEENTVLVQVLAILILWRVLFPVDKKKADLLFVFPVMVEQTVSRGGGPDHEQIQAPSERGTGCAVCTA